MKLLNILCCCFLFHGASFDIGVGHIGKNCGVPGEDYFEFEANNVSDVNGHGSDYDQWLQWQWLRSTMDHLFSIIDGGNYVRIDSVMLLLTVLANTKNMGWDENIDYDGGGSELITLAKILIVMMLILLMVLKIRPNSPGEHFTNLNWRFSSRLHPPIITLIQDVASKNLILVINPILVMTF